MLSSIFQIQMHEQCNGENQVDFVLVYDASTRDKKSSSIFDEESKTKIRQIFEKNLTSEGLDLEREIINSLTFVKIRAPKPLLKKYCEHMKLKMPLKEVNEDVCIFSVSTNYFLPSLNSSQFFQTKEEQQELLENFNFISGVKTAFVKFIKYFVTIDPRKHYQAEVILYAEYNREKYYL